MSLHTDMGDSFVVSLCISGSDVTRISIGNAQSRGAREYQEDNFGYTPLNKVDSNGFVAVVADGMGGLAAGDKVSAYVVSSMLGMRDLISGSDVADRFRQTVSQLNYEVVRGGTGGGCTLAAVYCRSDGIYWCSVGDSRIYLYRSGMVFQLSQDGDYQNQLLDDVIAERLSFEDMIENPKKDSLVHYIGSKNEPIPDVNIHPLVPSAGDKLLICSDGVYNALSDEEMSLALAYPAQQAADAIAGAIINKNYTNQDNNTMIVLEFI
ncbi:MAG: serine/threonine-protein phosphatase [Oscillospiraceae bacterium]|nr:serine/threonine-protein phosphatase [Oscillospiraceae bacterium]